MAGGNRDPAWQACPGPRNHPMTNPADQIYRDFHLVRNADPVVLRNPTYISAFLGNMIEALKMTELARVVVPVYGTEPYLNDQGGVTGMSIISTSHCGIHTWPETGSANIDIYSCKAYDHDALDEIVKQAFGTDIRRI